jgi:hypothetical protein
VIAVPLGPALLEPRAQVRPRFEVIPDRSLAGDAGAGVVSHRVRFGGQLTLDVVDMMIEVQDVRFWGSEVVPSGLPQDPTMFGHVEGSFDLHQGYLALRVGEIEARLGRQEISIGAERLIGAAQFVQLGRAFDAVRVVHRGEHATTSAFFAILSSKDAAPGQSNATLGGLFADVRLAQVGMLSPVLLVDTTSASERARTTLGARFDGAWRGLFYDFEAYGQLARFATGDLKGAALLGARGAYQLEAPLHPRAGFVLDVVSGSPDSGSFLTTFDTLHGTNHKFYGLADMFLNLPAHTGGQGLVDAAATLSFFEGPLSVGAALHALSPFSSFGHEVFGVEPDVYGSWRLQRHLTLELGAALFVPLSGAATAAWAYAELNVQL